MVGGVPAEDVVSLLSEVRDRFKLEALLEIRRGGGVKALTWEGRAGEGRGEEQGERIGGGRGGKRRGTEE